MMWNAADRAVANNNISTKRSEGDAARDGDGGGHIALNEASGRLWSVAVDVVVAVVHRLDRRARRAMI